MKIIKHLFLLFLLAVSISFAYERCTCEYNCTYRDRHGVCCRADPMLTGNICPDDLRGSITWENMTCYPKPPGCLGTCTKVAQVPGTTNSGCILSFSGFDETIFTVQDICKGIRTTLPPLSVLMIISAGVTYIGGQFAGAETRARANVWATAMLTGAIIGLVMSAVVPSAVTILARAAVGRDYGIVC